MTAVDDCGGGAGASKLDIFDEYQTIAVHLKHAIIPELLSKIPSPWPFLGRWTLRGDSF